MEGSKRKNWNKGEEDGQRRDQSKIQNRSKNNGERKYKSIGI